MNIGTIALHIQIFLPAETCSHDQFGTLRGDIHSQNNHGIKTTHFRTTKGKLSKSTGKESFDPEVVLHCVDCINLERPQNGVRCARFFIYKNLTFLRQNVHICLFLSGEG